jgi:hypothetical protein
MGLSRILDGFEYVSSSALTNFLVDLWVSEGWTLWLLYLQGLCHFSQGIVDYFYDPHWQLTGIYRWWT